ncbi:integrase core domain-containing protein [Mesorhizobium sp. BHbsci]
MQNGICEALNGRGGTSDCTRYSQYDLDHARLVIARWVAGCSERRQHSALGSHVRPYAATLTATHGCATRPAPAIACCSIPLSDAQLSTENSGVSRCQG